WSHVPSPPLGLHLDRVRAVENQQTSCPLDGRPEQWVSTVFGAESRQNGSARRQHLAVTWAFAVDFAGPGFRSNWHSGCGCSGVRGTGLASGRDLVATRPRGCPPTLGYEAPSSGCAEKGSGHWGVRRPSRTWSLRRFSTSSCNWRRRERCDCSIVSPFSA